MAKSKKDKASKKALSKGGLYTQEAISNFFTHFGKRPDNDEVLRKAGITRHRLSVLLDDDEIAQAVETRIDALLATPFRIEPSDTPEAVYLKAELDEWYFEIASAALNALFFGYSVQEAVYEVKQEGYLGLQWIGEKPMQWFEPKNDGRLIYRQDGGGADREVDQFLKFFLTRRKATFEQPYGKALLATLYWLFFFKQNGFKFWAKFLERFGTPILLGKCKDTETDDMSQALLNAHAQSVLSIDIDGNDIYVWDSINVINPRVVVIEYNGKLSPSVDWVQPYNPNFIWDSTDYSGASLNHINKVANDKGYQLVGTNVAGVNAFFVRKELCSSLFYDSNNIEDFYNPARYHLVSKPIGHPSFAYIGDRDNPELWYQNGKSLQFVDGFSYRETLSDGREFSWSNALKSTFLLLQNETGKYSLDVLIHLNNTKIKLKLPDETLEFVLNLGFNKLEFNILNTNIKWIKIEIILESLWSPMTSDTRELGIAIIA